jgi:putative methionine-R-sulfoxide reductase with GAF domain
VLDIDSAELAAFDDTDRHYLEQVAAVVARATAGCLREWAAMKIFR